MAVGLEDQRDGRADGLGPELLVVDRCDAAREGALEEEGVKVRGREVGEHGVLAQACDGRLVAERHYVVDLKRKHKEHVEVRQLAVHAGKHHNALRH